jgi:LacI family transcriptional regulator
MKKIVLLIETSREFGRQLLSGINRYSKRNGPWSFYKEQDGLKSSVPPLKNWKPDGIIMRNSMIKKELLELKIPTILALHDSMIPKNLPIIKTDSYNIAKMAAEHLLAKGFKNFAFCGYDKYEWSNERKYSFEEFINSAGFKTFNYNSIKKKQTNDWKSEQLQVTNWLKSLPKPVGIMTCNDDRGHHILEVCKLNGYKVPDDIAVIGVDNDPMICEFEDPPLSSIALNIESAGYSAAHLLDRLMNGEKIQGQQIIVLPTHVVQRQSTDILAIKDEDLLEAIRFIHKNATNKIHVNQIVKATNVGRRVLERKFNKIIRKSIYAELSHIRTELISKMLVETDLQISEIVSLFNFTDIAHVSRFFKKEKGIGMSQFRKQNRLQ